MISSDDDRNTKGYFERGEDLQASVWHLDASVIAIRPVTAENIDLIPLLQRPYVLDMRLYHFPKCFDVLCERRGFRQWRFEVPRIIF